MGKTPLLESNVKLAELKLSKTFHFRELIITVNNLIVIQNSQFIKTALEITKKVTTYNWRR